MFLIFIAVAWKGPIIYNAKVARELIKEFYVRHDLRPPQRFELDEAKKEVKQLFSFFRSGQFLNMKVREAIQKGLIGVEILGFFFIGEIIGKRKLFGYKDYETSVSAAHHWVQLFVDTIKSDGTKGARAYSSAQREWCGQSQAVVSLGNTSGHNFPASALIHPWFRPVSPLIRIDP